jgi:hypothetical protein
MDQGEAVLRHRFGDQAKGGKIPTTDDRSHSNWGSQLVLVYECPSRA